MHWKKNLQLLRINPGSLTYEEDSYQFAQFAELIYNENVRPGRRTQHISVVLYNLSQPGSSLYRPLKDKFRKAVDQYTFQISSNLDIGTTATANESHIPVKPRKAGV